MLLSGPAANFLIKELQSSLDSGKASRPELTYLTRKAASEEAVKLDDNIPRPLSDAQLQLHIVGHRASRLVHALYQLRSKPSEEKIVTAHLDARLAARASKAHGAYFILYSFIATVDSLRKDKGSSGVGVPVDEEICKVLDKVRTLYAIETCILDDLGDYTEDGYLTVSIIQEAQRESARLMAGLRPDILGLAEAADMRDWYLASPLGSSDGKAYERMVEFMKSEPINQMGENGARDEFGVLKGFRNVLGNLTHGEVEGWNEQEAAKREEERKKERLAKL